MDRDPDFHNPWNRRRKRGGGLQQGHGRGHGAGGRPSRHEASRKITNVIIKGGRGIAIHVTHWARESGRRREGSHRELLSWYGIREQTRWQPEVRPEKRWCVQDNIRSSRRCSGSVSQSNVQITPPYINIYKIQLIKSAQMSINWYNTQTCTHQCRLQTHLLWFLHFSTMI